MSSKPATGRDAMDLDPRPACPTVASPKPQRSSERTSKTRTLATATLQNRWAFAHLTIAAPIIPASSSSGSGNGNGSANPNLLLDDLQVRAYLTAALRQFLGDTGAAIPVDILLARGRHVWVRVPRPDLGAFAAAITAFPGLPGSSSSSSSLAAAGVGEGTLLLQLDGCGDWLGSVLGRMAEEELWGS
ncbi:hypothetical protein VTK56DRAFT_7382 [Thermocarpiscus australiensis]